MCTHTVYTYTVEDNFIFKNIEYVIISCDLPTQLVQPSSSIQAGIHQFHPCLTHEGSPTVKQVGKRLARIYLLLSLGVSLPGVVVQKQQIQITFPITRVDWGQIYTLLRLPIYISHGPMCPMPSMKREFEHCSETACGISSKVWSQSQ